MKKFTFIALACACFSLRSFSQNDLGYRTTDLGTEYLWADNRWALNLQAALNAKLHHSFIGSLGYKTAYRPVPGSHNIEKGTGWGGSLGYRYYFSYVPKRFFIGGRAYIWSMKMYHTEDITSDKVQVMLAQPSAEIGYTALINDLFFITTYFSAGKQFTINSPSESFVYGKGLVTTAGISAGFRF